MSTLALPKPSVFAFSTGFSMQPAMFRKDNGNLALQRVAVFRSGTFRDSMGYQSTWESIHMKQMIDNWNHLRDGKLFDDVPVRDGHPGWLIHGLPGNGKVVGWHTNLVTEKAKSPVDDEEYDYIFADYEITDPEAAAAIENGTWRNRSAEIGTYITNSEAEFWPVYMGFAYVDIPAVEGLKFRGANGVRVHAIQMDKKETSVADNSTTPASGNSSGDLPFQIGNPTAQVYSVNGQQVTDPVAIQNHINTLEQFRRDTQEQNRREFVNSLAAAGKIAATQVDSMAAFALGLNTEQYESWTKTYEAAPTLSVLGQHGVTVTNPTNTSQGNPAEEQIKVWEATVAQHKMAGTPKVAIEKTASYKALVAAGRTPAL